MKRRTARRSLIDGPLVLLLDYCERSTLSV